MIYSAIKPIHQTQAEGSSRPLPFFLRPALLSFALTSLLLALSACSAPENTPEQDEQDYEFQGFSNNKAANSAVNLRYLTEEVHKLIEADKGSWNSIVLHSSGGRGENFSALERHHEQVLGIPDGLAYHFLIGDGTAEKAGEIYVSERWKRGLDGAVLRSVLDQDRIHICLLGRREDQAPAEQLAALDELLALLQPRYNSKIFAHDQLEPIAAMACPGERLQASHWQQLQKLYPEAVTIPESAQTALEGSD